MTVGQVMEEVRGDVSYFRHSGGGVTLSGGEPMAQFRFTAALLEALRRGGYPYGNRDFRTRPALRFSQGAADDRFVVVGRQVARRGTV